MAFIYFHSIIWSRSWVPWELSKTSFVCNLLVWLFRLSNVWDWSFIIDVDSSFFNLLFGLLSASMLWACLSASFSSQSDLLFPDDGSLYILMLRVRWFIIIIIFYYLCKVDHLLLFLRVHLWNILKSFIIVINIFFIILFNSKIFIRQIIIDIYIASSPQHLFLIGSA